MRNLAFAAVVAFQPVIALASEAVTFDGSWKEQGFLRLFSNDYIQRGRQLDVISDGTVSLLWRPVRIPEHAPIHSDNMRPLVPGYPPTSDALP